MKLTDLPQNLRATAARVQAIPGVADADPADLSVAEIDRALVKVALGRAAGVALLSLKELQAVAAARRIVEAHDPATIALPTPPPAAIAVAPAPSEAALMQRIGDFGRAMLALTDTEVDTDGQLDAKITSTRSRIFELRDALIDALPGLEPKARARLSDRWYQMIAQIASVRIIRTDGWNISKTILPLLQGDNLPLSEGGSGDYVERYDVEYALGPFLLEPVATRDRWLKAERDFAATYRTYGEDRAITAFKPVFASAPAVLRSHFNDVCALYGD
jgi:hypothetical protein